VRSPSHVTRACLHLSAAPIWSARVTSYAAAIFQRSPEVGQVTILRGSGFETITMQRHHGELPHRRNRKRRLSSTLPAVANLTAYSFTIELQTNGFSRESLLRGLLICIERNGKADRQHDCDHNGDAEAAHSASLPFMPPKSGGRYPAISSRRSRAPTIARTRTHGPDRERRSPPTFEPAESSPWIVGPIIAHTATPPPRSIAAIFRRAAQQAQFRRSIS
jgi:hypothetical protein